MIRAATLSVALALGSVGARAEYLTGADLLSLMGSGEHLKMAVAYGYVLGAFDAGKGGAHCAPEIKPSDLVGTVEATLRKSRELLEMSADQAVIRGLAAVFPCDAVPKPDKSI